VIGKMTERRGEAGKKGGIVRRKGRERRKRREGVHLTHFAF